jgi:hypothetical protein
MPNQSLEPLSSLKRSFAKLLCSFGQAMQPGTISASVLYTPGNLASTLHANPPNQSMKPTNIMFDVRCTMFDLAQQPVIYAKGIRQSR